MECSRDCLHAQYRRRTLYRHPGFPCSLSIFISHKMRLWNCKNTFVGQKNAGEMISLAGAFKMFSKYRNPYNKIMRCLWIQTRRGIWLMFHKSSYTLKVLPCFNLQTNDDGESSCDFTTCDAAPTATAVEAFAASNQVFFPRPFFYILPTIWLNLYLLFSIYRYYFVPNKVWVSAFTEVFTKMLAHGSTELFDPEDAWTTF